MKISVTQQHINEGKRGDCYECALALAAREAFPQYQARAVNVCRADFSGLIVAVIVFSEESQDVAHLQVLQDNAKLVEFIKHFDVGLPVEPFEFEGNLRHLRDLPVSNIPVVRLGRIRL